MSAPGLCQCGCGRQTMIAHTHDPRYGNVKGQPCRFVRGHGNRGAGRRRSGGYVLVKVPSHPRAFTNGFVLEHIVVVERVLGRRVDAPHVIHHVDDNGENNVANNLVVLQDQGEHVRLHTRRTVLRAGGNPWTQRMCSYCATPKDFAVFYPASDRTISSACRDCSRARSRERQRRLRQIALPPFADEAVLA